MKHYIQFFKNGKKKKCLEFSSEEKATKEFEKVLDKNPNAACGQEGNEFWIDI